VDDALLAGGGQGAGEGGGDLDERLERQGTVRLLDVLPLLCLAASVAPPAAAPPPATGLQPITHEALWLMKRVGSPAWSPDSRRIAFTAKRDDDEVAQVYVLDFAAGGEARRVTSSPLAAIACQSAVHPGATDLEGNRRLAAERKESKSKVRRYESFPIRRCRRGSWCGPRRTTGS
jgi:hypothetical protein